VSDPAVETCRRSDIVRELEQRYPQLETCQALRAVVDGVRALAIVGLADDEDADRMLARIAERQVRLQLGLDAPDARLDPQSRRRAGADAG